MYRGCLHIIFSPRAFERENKKAAGTCQSSDTECCIAMMSSLFRCRGRPYQGWAFSYDRVLLSPGIRESRRSSVNVHGRPQSIGDEHSMSNTHVEGACLRSRYRIEVISNATSTCSNDSKHDAGIVDRSVGIRLPRKVMALEAA